MLEKFTARSQKEVDIVINTFMNTAKGWAVMQPDCGKVIFPAEFVIVPEHRICLATVHSLN